MIWGPYLHNILILSNAENIRNKYRGCAKFNWHTLFNLNHIISSVLPYNPLSV